MLLRQEAIQLLNEITTVYPSLLASTTHISLHLLEGETRVIIKSRLDFEQKTALLGVLKNKGFKLIDTTTDFEEMLIIY